MLFALPASDATIAAVNAAIASPFKPAGKKASIAEQAPSFPPSKPAN